MRQLHGDGKSSETAKLPLRCATDCLLGNADLLLLAVECIVECIVGDRCKAA